MDSNKGKERIEESNGIEEEDIEKKRNQMNG